MTRMWQDDPITDSLRLLELTRDRIALSHFGVKEAHRVLECAHERMKKTHRILSGRDSAPGKTAPPGRASAGFSF